MRRCLRNCLGSRLRWRGGLDRGSLLLAALLRRRHSLWSYRLRLRGLRWRRLFLTAALSRRHSVLRSRGLGLSGLWRGCLLLTALLPWGDVLPFCWGRLWLRGLRRGWLLLLTPPLSWRRVLPVLWRRLRLCSLRWRGLLILLLLTALLSGRDVLPVLWSGLRLRGLRRRRLLLAALLSRRQVLRPVYGCRRASLRSSANGRLHTADSIHVHHANRCVGCCITLALLAAALVVWKRTAGILGECRLLLIERDAAGRRRRPRNNGPA